MGATELVRRGLVGLLTAAVVVGPFAGGSQAAPQGLPKCAVPGQITPHPVNWYSVKAPAFPVGDQIITGLAVEPLLPEHLYVTNGSAVMRSMDSGCHWSNSFTLPTTGPGATVDNAVIQEIEVSSPNVVYLPIQQSSPAPQPHVQISQDAGASWAPAEGALLNATVGEILDLDASLGNGSAAAVLIDARLSEPGVVRVEGQQALFVTERAGAVWEPRHVNQDDTTLSAGGFSASVLGDGELDSIVMNPVRPNEIWLYGDGGVFRSDGAAVTPVPALGTVDVLDISLDGVAVMGYTKGGSGSVSFTGGTKFKDFDAGFAVDSVDLALGVPSLGALSGFGKVYYQVVVPGQKAPIIQDVSPLDGRAISDVQLGIVETATFPAIYGLTRNTIEVTYEPVGEVVDPEQVDAVIAEPPPTDLGNRLSPASHTEMVQPGGTKHVPYVLDLPAATTPLDVYFMVDISGSMQGTIDGIRGAMQEIVEQLASRKIDVRFGVGSFRAYNDQPAYERDRDIGPVDQNLAEALNGLRADGGGSETQMAALLQSVTGEGDGVIPPDLNMHFRPGSLRVAILATDEVISQGGRHPAYTTVIDALQAADVKAAGLAIQSPPLLGENDYDDPGPPADIMQKVATGSDAVAPLTGVDCDGDGVNEIDAGDPLVCLVDPSRASDAALMAGAIVNVLQAVEDVQQLDVSATPLADSDALVIESVEPAAFPGVDLKEPSHHEFEVTVHCPRLSERKIHSFELSAAQRGVPLAAATLTVVCKPLPIEDKEKPAPILTTIVPIAAVLPPPPRPPDPVPEPNPNPQPNPQQNPQAQAGLAAQEQQQPQVALAHQEGLPVDVADQPALDEYLMSARRATRVPPVAFVFAAGMITSTFAYAIARRRFDLARARNRRGRRS